MQAPGNASRMGECVAMMNCAPRSMSSSKIASNPSWFCGESLPVRARVRIAPVAALHVAERRAHRTGGETLGVARTVAVLVVEVEQPLLELLAFDGEPALKSEKVLGPQEEPPVGALRPGEPQRSCETPLRLERAVPHDLGRPNSRQGGSRGDPLEQGGLPRAVLTHEARHACRQVERRQRTNRRHGERERRLARGRGRARLQADGEEVGHGAY